MFMTAVTPIEQNLAIYTEIRKILNKVIKHLSQELTDNFFQRFNILRTEFEVKSGLTNDDTALALIFNWMSFDATVDKKINGPLIRYYYKNNAKTMDETEKKICKSLFSSRIGIFEIVETKPGIGLTIQDLFTNKKHFIFDTSLSRNAVKWGVFIERLLIVDDIKCLTGYPMAIDLELANYLVKESKLEQKNKNKKMVQLL